MLIAARSIAAVFLLALTAAVCPAHAQSPVTIRIYSGGAADAATRDSAIRTAAAIVGGEGVNVTWRDCTGDAAGRRCDPARGARDLIVRIMPTVDGDPARPQTSRMILGAAVVPSTGGGVLATIFMDRVRAIAERAAMEPSVLLGRTIAHEVGHLLTGSRGHTDSGLMRKVWTGGELARNRPEEWQFTPAESSSAAGGGDHTDADTEPAR